MSDIALHQLDDGGEMDIVNGAPVMDDGIATAVYLSLFGGNEDDSGLEADAASQWWGNVDEPNGARRYRSEVQFLLHALPAVPANLRRVEDAALRDLNWMVDELGATLAARATIPALDTIRLQVAVEIDGTKHPFAFTNTKAP